MAEEAGSADGADVKGGKTGNAGRRALRTLRRARAAYEAADWEESREAAFLLDEARVLALIDIAAAIRAQDR